MGRRTRARRGWRRGVEEHDDDGLAVQIVKGSHAGERGEVEEHGQPWGVVIVRLSSGERIAAEDGDMVLDWDTTPLPAEGAPPSWSG